MIQQIGKPEVIEKVKQLEQMSGEEITSLYNNDNIRVGKVVSLDTRKRFNINVWAKEAIKDEKGKYLDVGCHDGVMCSIADELGFEVHGVDIADISVERAKQNVPKGTFKKADATELPYENEMFDVITCTQTIEHLKDPKLALRVAYDKLKKGGVLIVTTPIEKRLNDSLHVHIFRLYDIIDMFEEIDKNFKISYINKFKPDRFKEDSEYGLIEKEVKWNDLNVFAVKLRKGGEENDRPRRQI